MGRPAPAVLPRRRRRVRCRRQRTRTLPEPRLPAWPPARRGRTPRRTRSHTAISVAVSVAIAVIAVVAVLLFRAGAIDDQPQHGNLHQAEPFDDARHQAAAVLGRLHDQDHAVDQSADDRRVGGGQGGRAVDEDQVVDRFRPGQQLREPRAAEQFRRIAGPRSRKAGCPAP